MKIYQNGVLANRVHIVKLLLPPVVPAAVALYQMRVRLHLEPALGKHHDLGVRVRVYGFVGFCSSNESYMCLCTKPQARYMFGGVLSLRARRRRQVDCMSLSASRARSLELYRLS